MSANQFASSPRAEPLERESAAGLLSRLLADVTALFRNEVALAKAEFAELTENAKAGIAAIAMAAVVLLAGLLALLARQKLQPSRHLDRVRSAVRNDAEVIARRT